MAWVSRVRRWSSSGATNTWHLPASRRNGAACMDAVEVALEARAERVGLLGLGSVAGPAARVAPGASTASSSTSLASRGRARWPGSPTHAGECAMPMTPKSVLLAGKLSSCLCAQGTEGVRHTTVIDDCRELRELVDELRR